MVFCPSEDVELASLMIDDRQNICRFGCNNICSFCFLCKKRRDRTKITQETLSKNFSSFVIYCAQHLFKEPNYAKNCKKLAENGPNSSLTSAKGGVP